MKLLEQIPRQKPAPKLLLHSCCAPCSTAVLERLSSLFSITVFYYNPNIHPFEEYKKRQQQQIKFINLFKAENKISYIEGEYEEDEFLRIAKGFEGDKEGGQRCFNCYFLRMEKTARLAAEGGFDFFTTTLSVSPYKNAKKLNEIGQRLEERWGVAYLYSDFKKKDGYKRSIQLSRQYDLYRQDYCGCVYSIKD